jgi:CheY-like chemotaxis protein
MVRADPDQMQLMILNLTLHAGRRIPDGGKIHISTENLEVAPDERGRKLQQYVKLSVSDTGQSLEREEIERLFEPLPPGLTAPQSAGTELFIVLSILNHADGRITVKSKPGEGMSFEVLLPRELVEQAAPRLGRGAVFETVKPTILVVEDDADIRTLLQNYFQRSGYHLLEARNGEEALMIADLHEGSIDLLISDVAMPLMSGPDLVRAMAPLRPEMKVLFISGYPHDFGGLDAFLKRGAHFLQKPFRQNELLLRVKQILRQGRANVN